MDGSKFVGGAALARKRARQVKYHPPLHAHKKKNRKNAHNNGCGHARTHQRAHACMHAERTPVAIRQVVGRFQHPPTRSRETEKPDAAVPGRHRAAAKDSHHSTRSCSPVSRTRRTRLCRRWLHAAYHPHGSNSRLRVARFTVHSTWLPACKPHISALTTPPPVNFRQRPPGYV